MDFFYNLNKRMADLAKKQDLTESVQPVAERSTGDYSAKKAAAGKDIGKPGKMFSKIAASAGKRYGSKESGERVAGAVLAKLRAKESVQEADMDEGKFDVDNALGDIYNKAVGSPIGNAYNKIRAANYDRLANKNPNDPQAAARAQKAANIRTAVADKNKLNQWNQHMMASSPSDWSPELERQKKANVVAHYKESVEEADMEEGNKFTGNLMKARAAGLKKADLDGDGDMETVREADVVGLGEKKKAKPDYIDLDKDGNRKETMKKAAADKKKMSEADPVGLEEKKKETRSKGTAFDPEVAKSMITKDPHPRYDVKDTGYSKRYTRKPEPEAEKDDEVSDQPKKKGRPKGPAKGPERVTKGSYKYKSGRPARTQEDLDVDGVMMTRPSNMSSEGMDAIALVDKGEYDREGDMAKEQLHTIKLAARELASILSDDENLPEWVQSKITKAMDYIDTARDYMIANKADGDMQPVAEKAVSVAQRRAAGIAHAAQKGEIPKKELRGASKEMAKMPKGELKKFAKTKEKDLPEKVKETDAKPAKKGGVEFGKGVYESMDSKFRQALTEGMNISVNMNTGPDGNPSKNITVSADGDDAEALAMLLKMAGMGTSHDNHQAVDENSPDYPTNTETSDDALQYSGGLNGPKSTGQTTIPVVASQLRRQVSMEESVELERDLFRLYQNYKAQ